MTLEVVYGLNSLTTEDRAAKYRAAAQKLGRAEHGVVDNGLQVTATATPLRLSVTGSEKIVLPGLLVRGDTQTINVPAGDAFARTDTLAVEMNWEVTGDAATRATTAAKLVVVPGTSTRAPTLLAEPGEKWQMPIADIVVPAGHTGVFTSAHIKPRVPKPVRVIPWLLEGWTAQTFGSGIAGGVLASVTVTDPGWPYRLVVASSQIHVAAANGRVSFELDATTPGVSPPDPVTFARGLSHTFQPNQESVQAVTTAGQMTGVGGSKLVRARISSVGVTSGQIAVQNPAYSHCSLLQVPIS